MPRRRAVNPLKDLYEQNEFQMLKIQRLRRLSGCHRYAAAKELMRKLVAMEKIFPKKQENE